MSAAANLAIYNLHVVACCNCGVRFALDGAYFQRVHADGSSWHCPNGHRQHFGDNELTRVTRERDNLAKRLEWAENDARIANEAARSEERRARALRGHATRLRRRIAEGKCPCCSRAFADLAAHIAEKHPRYRPTEGS